MVVGEGFGCVRAFIQGCWGESWSQQGMREGGGTWDEIPWTSCVGYGRGGMEEKDRGKKTYRELRSPQTRLNDRRSPRKRELVGMDDGTRA